MNFELLDQQMRVYETQHDHYIDAHVYLAARLDGRNFTRLTKQTIELEKPFDVRFHQSMIQTVRHLMTCGFHILYGYTESDEISLLFHPHEHAFNRKERKLVSTLAGEASATLSLQWNLPVCFDCRICLLPSVQTVVDYFRWRAEDAHRNALSAWCYWTLRGEGKSPSQASSLVENRSLSDKVNFLKEHGIDFEQLPRWQKRGSGVVWEEREVVGFNPKTQAETVTTRRILAKPAELPEGEAYSDFMRSLLTKALDESGSIDSIP